MKIRLTSKIAVIFGLLVVATLFHFRILINTEKMMNENHNWVLHTHEVIRESERLLAHLRDAETGQRGFLLTLNNRYLDPYNNGITQSDSTLAILEKLTQDNMEQQTRLGHIQALMRGKISELEKTIQLAQQDRMAEAMEIVNSDHGKIVMDTIRELMREFISAEEKLLKQRNELYLENKHNLIFLFYIEAIVLVVLILISCLFIQKAIVRPLIVISEYITKEGNTLVGTGVKIKSRHDEIGTLVEAFNTLHRDLKEQTNKKNELISELQDAVNEIRTLEGIIPICSYCKEIRDDKGSWSQLETYISQHSHAQFSHSICDNCLEKHFPEHSGGSIEDTKK